MVDLMELIGKWFEALGLSGSFAVLTCLYLMCGVRIVKTGYKGVYFRMGKALEKQVEAGPHWRPFLFYRLKVRFCGDQVKILPRFEVVTKEGVTCVVSGSISYNITNVVKAETEVYDSDDQMAAEAVGEIHDWVAERAYAQCIEEGLGRKMMEKAARRVRDWGISVKRLNIETFTPANPEARALVFTLAIAQKRAESLKVMLDKVRDLTDIWRPAGVNPSVLIAAQAGVPMSVMSYTEQIGEIRDTLSAVERRLEAQEEVPSFTEKLAQRAGELIPGGDRVVEAIAGAR